MILFRLIQLGGKICRQIRSFYAVQGCADNLKTRLQSGVCRFRGAQYETITQKDAFMTKKETGRVGRVGLRFSALLIAVVATLFSVSAQTSLRSLRKEGVQNERSNLERQPDWGPVGYPLAEFYYIPALDVYYDVEQAVFYVEEEGRWRASATLPERLSGSDLYACYKVVINGAEPWRNHRNHTFVYDDYRNKRFRQQTILASRQPDGKDKGIHNPRKERKRRERDKR